MRFSRVPVDADARQEEGKMQNRLPRERDSLIDNHLSAKHNL